MDEYQAIRRTIERLNWSHGWGDVAAVRRFMDGRIEVDVTSQYRAARTYLARAVGRSSVRFRGHQQDYTKGE
jgi:hypothetical protein